MSSEKPIIEIPNSDVVVKEKIGRGGYGNVYRGYWESKEMAVAIKITIDVEKEARIWSSLDHDNIIKFFGIRGLHPPFSMVIELAENGSLHNFLDPRNETNLIENALHWEFQVASGVHYLHERKIIHRDLKADNVVITGDMVAKLCDFGTSRILNTSTVVTMRGSIPWMSPEMINQSRENPVNKLTDSWSFGVLLWEILIRETPYKDLNDATIIYKISNGLLKLNLPDNCPQSMAELIKGCMMFHRNNRPSFDKIMLTLDKIIGEKKGDITEFIRSKQNWKEFQMFTFTDAKDDKERQTKASKSSKIKILAVEHYYGHVFELMHTSQSWTVTSNLSTSSVESICMLDGYIYLIGTKRKRRTETTEITEFTGVNVLNPSQMDASKIFEVCGLTCSRRGACSCVANGTIYVFGGRWSNSIINFASIEAYNKDIQTWMQLPQNGETPKGRAYAACVAVNYDGCTELWITGGRDASSSTFAGVDIYDTINAKWRRGPELLYGRLCHACIYHDEQIIISGGFADGFGIESTYDSVHSFNLRQNKWIEMPSMKIARYGHAMAIMDSKLYAMGGRGNHQQYQQIFVETLDLIDKNAVWQTEAEMQHYPTGAMAGAVVIENS